MTRGWLEENTWLLTRAYKYCLSALGTYMYFECEMYLFGLYLVTMEMFIDQRSQIVPPSMVYTTHENALDQQEMEADLCTCADFCSINTILMNREINNNRNSLSETA